jgi:hypothetical protein
VLGEMTWVLAGEQDSCYTKDYEKNIRYQYP